MSEKDIESMVGEVIGNIPFCKELRARDKRVDAAIDKFKSLGWEVSEPALIASKEVFWKKYPSGLVYRIIMKFKNHATISIGRTVSEAKEVAVHTMDLFQQNFDEYEDDLDEIFGKD